MTAYALATMGTAMGVACVTVYNWASGEAMPTHVCAAVVLVCCMVMALAMGVVCAQAEGGAWKP